MVKHTRYGAFLKDFMPKRRENADKVWITEGYLSQFCLFKTFIKLNVLIKKMYLLDDTLLEYNNLKEINDPKIRPKVYTLPESYYGTGHIIYQGAFFYHSHNTDKLVRYDLNLNKIVAELSLKLPTNDTTEKFCRVYSDHREHVGCVDFSVDENGNLKS